MEKKQGFIVAVDGPAGSGKSSICARACQRLDWTYVNTGAIYRAVGVLMARAHVTPDEEQRLATLIDQFATDLRWTPETRQLYVGDENLTPYLTSEVAGKNASTIAKIAFLREKLLPVQRQLAMQSPRGALLDGRDIGTVVFPNADLKIFMTAGLEQRAVRRLAQLQAKEPHLAHPSLEAVMEDMAKRDLQDSSRGVAPLVQAPDALVLDTSELTFEESIEALITMIRQHLPVSA